MQRCAMRVIGGATDEILADVEGHVALGTIPVDDLDDLGHDFGADAIAGQDQKRGVAHWACPLELRVPQTAIPSPGNGQESRWGRAWLREGRYPPRQDGGGWRV